MGSDLVGRVNAMIKRAIVGVAAATVLTASAAYAQFVNMREISELNTGFGESHIAVSQDNLRCFFSTDRLDPGPRNMDVWYAERATLADPFTLIGPVAELSTAQTDKTCFLSPDELTLYLARPLPLPLGNWDLYVATRPNISSPFNTPTVIAELDTGYELNATVSSDGLEMLFEYMNKGRNQIMRSTRPTTTSLWASAQLVTELVVSEFQVKPTFYMDDLQLVFGCDLRWSGDIDVCYTKRASTSDPWEMPVVLADISTLGFNDTPSAFVGSAPDRFLYFYTNRPLGELDDLWVVQIPCSSTTLPADVKLIYLTKDFANPGKIKLFVPPQLDCVNAFNVYENDFGKYTFTNQLSCGNVATAAITLVTFSLTPNKPSQYFVVTGSNKIGEGPAGTIPTPQSCGPY